MSADSGRYIGLISGTSADGIDAAAVQFEVSQCQLQAFHSFSYPSDLIRRLEPLLDVRQTLSASAYGELDAQIGDAFAEAANRIIKAAGWSHEQIDAIGSHGQTIYHGADRTPPFSVQLGDPNRIAYQTRVPVIADFRRMDLAAGGQAAPYAPLIHAVLFHTDSHSEQYTQAVVNIGGIANVSWLAGNTADPVSGFDSGPGNCLMNAWCRQHQQQPFDAEGNWARSGTVHTTLLDALLSDPYLRQPPPKSTGREYFTLAWLERRYPRLTELAAADVQATLLQLTSATITTAITHCGKPKRVIVCGGGVHNTALLNALTQAMPETPVCSSAVLGINPDAVEAILFAWMAQRRWTSQPIDTRAITGAQQPLLLGNLFQYQ